MSVQSAAIQVLKKAGKPLHATEIAKLIIKDGLSIDPLYIYLAVSTSYPSSPIPLSFRQ